MDHQFGYEFWHTVMGCQYELETTSMTAFLTSLSRPQCLIPFDEPEMKFPVPYPREMIIIPQPQQPQPQQPQPQQPQPSFTLPAAQDEDKFQTQMEASSECEKETDSETSHKENEVAQPKKKSRGKSKNKRMLSDEARAKKNEIQRQYRERRKAAKVAQLQKPILSLLDAENIMEPQSGQSEEQLELEEQEQPEKQELVLHAIDLVAEERRQKVIRRYKEKRQQRSATHKVRYAARKAFADSRPRKNGKFLPIPKVDKWITY